MAWLRGFAILLLCAAPAAAGDWPQWLGPTRDGVSPEKVAAWKGDPEVLWRQPVGEGHSSPVVAAGRVYLHTRVAGKDEEELAAFDAATGKELWRSPYARPAFKSLFGSGPRATPAVVDGRVYTYGITGILTCFDAQSGRQVWQVDALKEFKAKNLFFGASCSPLAEGGRVFVNVGGPGASVVAFDKDTGKVVWTSLDDAASYSSPIVFGQGAMRQVVFLTQKGLASLNPADGKPFWQFPLKDELLESSTTPLRAGEFLLGSSITFGSVGLRLADQGGKPAAEQAWKNASLTCYFSTPVAVGPEYVYIVTGTNPLAGGKAPEAALHSIEARTGNVLWTRPKVAKYHAALLRTGDGKVLMVDDATNVILLDPDAKEYRELARSKVCGETWAHPALANGRLYLRDGKELLCLRLGE
jgi:outer membrane protein assembly factor BamB